MRDKPRENTGRLLIQIKDDASVTFMVATEAS
jgi:hypothetical protein